MTLLTTHLVSSATIHTWANLALATYMKDGHQHTQHFLPHPDMFKDVKKGSME